VFFFPVRCGLRDPSLNHSTNCNSIFLPHLPAPWEQFVSSANLPIPFLFLAFSSSQFPFLFLVFPRVASQSFPNFFPSAFLHVTGVRPSDLSVSLSWPVSLVLRS
jgi:hypothetical protein